MCFLNPCDPRAAEEPTNGCCISTTNQDGGCSIARIALSISTFVAAIFSSIGFLATGNPIALGLAMILGLITLTMWPSSNSSDQGSTYIRNPSDVFDSIYSVPRSLVDPIGPFATEPLYPFTRPHYMDGDQRVMPGDSSPIYYGTGLSGNTRINVGEQQAFVSPAACYTTDDDRGEQRVMPGQNTPSYHQDTNDQRVPMKRT